MAAEEREDDVSYDYEARCSQKNCRHLSISEIKNKYHCTTKECKNDSSVCEQHSARGRELLDARLKRDGKY